MGGFIINRKSYFALVFMFGLALFLTISGVSAATWTVNPGENIQSVINNASSNDTIVVNDNNGSAYTYTGNLVVNKTLSLQAKQDGLVAIQATNSSKPVITINLLGNDTKIQGFIIKGATNSDGIYLNGTSGCNITENSLTNNLYGIYLDTSLNSTISMNTIINNTNSGICLNDSSATVKFNRITGNSKYGLYNIGNGVVNATNNWWGTNTPIMSANSTSDICAAGGTVTYNPWLVLNMTADPGSTNGNSSVTVDLTHNNNGEDTSSSGNVPDDIPINFTTDVGTINSPVNTKNGKTNTIFNSGASTSGTAKITTSLDRQTVQTNVNIDKTAPTIVSSDPKNNEIEVPGNKVIKTTFSEPVKVGTNWIELADGNGTMVPITTSICGNVLTVTPAVFLTNGTRYTLLIHTGSLKDLAGNNVAGYVTRFNTDSMAPVITGSDPVKNAVNVPINEIIKVTFNEPIKTGTNWIELVDSNGTMVPITTSICGNVLTVTPAVFLTNGTRYALLIHTGSVKDLAGNNVVGYVTSFDTDSMAPLVTGSDPVKNAVNVPINEIIKVTFNEPIKTGTDWIELMDDGNGAMVPITISICGNVLTVTPAVFLTNGTRYALLIHTGSVKDLAGNNVAGYVTRFNTDGMAPLVTGSDPVKNAMNVPINEIIKVTFNEPIKTGTNWIELMDNSNRAMVPITTVIGSNTLTITPQNLLIDGRKYSVLIHTGSLKDLAGNNVAAYVTSFATGGIIDTAERVKTYVETNHCLPSSVTISGIQVNMPQFLQLSAKTVLNINNDVNTPIVLGNVGSAPNPAETMTNGIFNSTEYLNIANRVNSFINSNGKAPNYATSSLGNMRYESLVYMYSQILSSYNNNNVLPGFIKVNSWAVVSNSNTVFYSVDQVNDAASRVKAYVEANHRLPNYVTMSGKQVTMPQFLQLSTTTLLNIEGNFDASTALQSYGSAPNPAETIKSKNMGQVEYVNIACNVQTFMDVFGKAPNYATSSLGNIRYESLVYTYSQLLNYYSLNNYLPENVAVDPWSVVSNSNTVFYSADQVNDAADQVKTYVEVNHRLPNYVTMSGKQVNMPQFLQLSNAELLNISGTLCTSFISRSYGAAPAPSETAKNGNINSTEYLDIANRVNSFMNSNSLAPNYATSSLGNIRYESLIYMNSQILGSYGSFNGTLPDYITVNPWTVVSNLNTVFIGMDQVNNASGTVKSYVETNHQLPNCVTISGKQVTMPQFLQLLTTTMLNRESNLNTSIVLRTIGNATNSTEDITSGDIQYSEYIDIAKDAKKFMDSNGTAPNYAYQTSLGTHMGFASLVYMYSQIMNSYHTNNTLPDYVTVTPWIAVSNPNAIYNYQSNKIFNSIQAAIDDLDTLNSETIGLGIGTILENVIVNKELTIMSIPTVNVTVKALNPNLPVFTITTDGSGSIIQDLVIQGSTNNAGIYINNSFYNTISDDIISFNSNGIYLDNATDNQIADSNILNNTLNGIFMDMGSDNNTVAGNTLTNNGYGISINGSSNNTVSNNILSNNSLDGINLKNSSADINFNKIVANSRYGLYNTGNGTVNATNNWWGSNSLEISSNDPSDICIAGGTVNCDQWLVLNVTSSCDRSNTNGTCYNYIITADLTKNNHGKDTTSGDGPSSGNTLPDGIPISFNTTFGTINTPVSTKNGKSVAIISSSAAGLANVSTTLDNQTITIPVNITSVNVLGIYNTRTNEGFTTIQSAINGNDTLDGDTITLADGTYTENVVVYKTLTIKPVSGANVTVQAADPYNAVFTIIGSGSTIQNLNIIGAADSCGILGYSNNLNITGNSISANNYGISLYNSNNNTISGNNVKNNWYGTIIFNSNNNTISGNNVTDNWYGLCSYHSTSTRLSENIITSNWYGLFINVSNGTSISGNTVKSNGFGMYLSNSTSTTISGNTVTDNEEGISYYKSNCTTSGNDIKNNAIVDSSVTDTTGIIIQTNIWNCGPASLATVMNNMGVNATQDELASSSGTDKSGTTMCGLVNAAQIKGLNAKGVILPVDQLESGNIVLLTVDGLYHFSVIKSINGTTVYLADSAFGNINMMLDNFTAMYSGYVLIITNNSTNSTVNGTILTNEQMQTIKGTSYGYLSGIGISFTEGSLFRFIPVVGVVVGTLAMIQPVGCQNEMYYINKYNNEHPKNTAPAYSNPHGYRINKSYKYTKTTSYYNRYPSKHKSGYVSPSKGYVSTKTAASIDLEYQRLYDKYLNKKSAELAKIYNTLNSGQKQEVIHVPHELKNLKSQGGSIKGPDGDKGEFILNLYKDSVKKINKGVAKCKAGDVVGGTADIALGIAGIHTANAYLISEILPEEVLLNIK